MKQHQSHSSVEAFVTVSGPKGTFSGYPLVDTRCGLELNLYQHKARQIVSKIQLKKIVITQTPNANEMLNVTAECDSQVLHLL